MQRVTVTAFNARSGDSTSGRGAWLPIFTGLILGILVHWLLGMWSAVAIGLPLGSSVIHPLTLLVLAIVTAGSVFLGMRWPIAGLTAGLTMLAIVVFAMVAMGGPVQVTSPWDVENLIGYGAVSGTPTIVGVVLVTSSSLRPVPGTSQRSSRQSSV